MQVSQDDIKLARIILEHSVRIKPKEKVLIALSEPDINPLVYALFVATIQMGAYPYLDISGINYYRNRATVKGLTYQFFQKANDWQLKYTPNEIIEAQLDWADAVVNIVNIENVKELSQIDSKKLNTRMKSMQPVIDKLIDGDRWVLTYYPTPSMAQEAGVSLDWLTDFYYKACVVDYKKMKSDLTKLEKVLDKGREIHVVGKDTDLILRADGRLAKACFGERNIPDGEVFLAPIAESVTGHVYFELPSIHDGREVSGIYLEFEKGKVVSAKATQGEDVLLHGLDTDKGARYLGEFAIGANYNITQVMKNTLFDEKIGGTVHMALGRSYKEKRGGAPEGANESAIHWDIVKDTRVKGSFVEVDGKTILKDGKILI
jgi:aminopeptidase